jgi:hypothetical protein
MLANQSNNNYLTISQMKIRILGSVLFLSSFLAVPFVANAATHSAGTNVLNNGTIYMVTADGQLRPYTSAGAFLSYGFNSWSNVVQANSDDLALSVGAFIPPRDGSIICSDAGSDKGTCYLITNGQKAAFTSENVFNNSGFSFKYALYGDVSFLPATNSISDASQAHLPGTLINDSGTVKIVGTNGTIGVPSMDVLQSWGYSLVDVVNANTADQALSQNSVLAAHTAGQLAYTGTASAPTTPSPAPTPTPVVTPQPTPAAPTSNNTDYSSYTSVTFSQYQNNPAAYTGGSIIVSGMNDAFIPSTGSAGSTNFVEVENPFDTTQPKIELAVNDPAAYTSLVNALQDKTQPIHLFLRAYGTGVSSEKFTSSSIFGSATILLPVLQVSRVDQCLRGSMNTTVLTGTSYESNFSCSSWSTIIPLSSAGTIYTTPTPTSTITTPAPTCNLSTTPASITSGQSAQLSWTSTNATTGSLNGVGSLSSLNGSMTISPSTSTNYTATFSGLGGSINCATSVSVTEPSTTTTPAAPKLNSNAALQSLTVNGTTVSEFSPNTYTYNVTLPAGSVVAPVVAAVAYDPTATAVIIQATDSLGTATVVVTAQNGTTNTYTLNFKPSGAGQCNFNGDVFYCASNAGITVSPTSLPNAIVGTNYSQAVTISDPDTSSQNFRWNIISGLFPPGLGFAFSPTKAIECTGTYCFFTSPPSGASASNSPGAFFGTPTTAGTYNFTFQAIDNLNYITLQTFSITVASPTSSQ